MEGRLLGIAALVVVAGAGALWFRRAYGVRLPRDRRGFVAAWLAGAALGIAAFGSGPGWLGGVAAGLALLGAVFFTFTVAISRQQLGETAIRVGETVPDVEAADANGDAFALASLRGRPFLLKFFRGHW